MHTIGHANLYYELDLGTNKNSKKEIVLKEITHIMKCVVYITKPSNCS